MSTLEQYDVRIARIMSKIEILRDKTPKFSCEKWPPVWEPPMTEEEMDNFYDEDTPFTFPLSGLAGILGRSDSRAGQRRIFQLLRNGAAAGNTGQPRYHGAENGLD